jgi:superfamily II DNA or RNA helicase
MSREILIESLSDEIREQVSNDLEIKIEGSTFVYNSQPKFIYPLDITDTHAYIPFAYGRTCTGGPYPCPERTTFSNTRVNFTGELRDIQKEIKIEAISHLNKYGSTVISAYPGCGKTALAIYISTKIKLQTLIITHRIVLIKQWKESIKKFCPDATVQILDSKSIMKKCDFYIMNAANVPKHPKSYYKNIAFVCVDEIHLIMAEGLSKCMQQLIPRYVLGLSATPYREDGLDPLINLYFGDRRITRKLYREHIVYKVDTNFTPVCEIARNGKINWGSVLDSQATSIERNELIIRIVKQFPENVFLILVKRISQGEYLVKRFSEEKEDVTSLLGKQQEYEQKSRILVGTTGKTSCGFDHPRLNALILGCDILQYYIQALGRIFRTTNGVPIVFDLLDKNGILFKHFKERRAVYIEHGGKIKDFSKEFPDFKLC